MASNSRSRDDSCDAAVMAAMEAIGEHCGDERVPVEAENGLVVMAPKEGLTRARSQADPEMEDEDIIDIVRNTDWLEEWTEEVCSSAGYRTGSRDCADCQARFARKILNP